MTFLEILKNKPPRALLWCVSAASAAFLAVALAAQYGFNLHPCELCMLQRYPYAAIVIIGPAAALFMKPKRLLYYALLLCIALLFLDAGIAGYHAGVELGVFPGPSACSSTDSPGESLEDMRKAIMNAALVPCNQPMATFLGLSMAAWNGIAAALTAVFTCIALRNASSNGKN